MEVARLPTATRSLGRTVRFSTRESAGPSAEKSSARHPARVASRQNNPFRGRPARALSIPGVGRLNGGIAGRVEASSAATSGSPFAVEYRDHSGSMPVFQLAKAAAAPAPQPPTAFATLMATVTNPFFCFFVVALTAAVTAFLVAVANLVRACREAVKASQAIVICTQNVNQAASAIQVTCARVDADLQAAEGLGAGALAALERATAEAGLLQRRLSDLPASASRTLVESITQGLIRTTKPPVLGGEICEVEPGGICITLGEEIQGQRVGDKWVSVDPNVQLTFSRSNVFRIGEYVAVPRTSNTYTWGVIEENDDFVPQPLDSVLEQRQMTLDEADFDYLSEKMLSEEAWEGQASGQPRSCEWPPTKESAARPAAATTAKAGTTAAGDPLRNNNSMVQYENNRDDSLSSTLSAVDVWKRRLGLDKVEHLWEQTPLGRALAPEKEYRVVVEFDNVLYSFKMMAAGELGKRVPVFPGGRGGSGEELDKGVPGASATAPTAATVMTE